MAATEKKPPQKDQGGDKKDKPGKKKRKNKTRELVECLLVAGALALGIRTFVFQIFKIPTRSMEPELIGNEDYGDRVVAAMWYNRHGFPRLPLAKPQRWQVIVFDHYVVEDGKKVSTNFIKRLIGLPGERVEIRDGDIWVQQPGKETAEIQRKPPEIQERLWTPLCDVSPAQNWRVPYFWESSGNVELGEGVPAIMDGSTSPASLHWLSKRRIDNRAIRLTVKEVVCPTPKCGRFKAVFDTARPVAFCPRCHQPVWGLLDPGDKGAAGNDGAPVVAAKELLERASPGGGDYWTENGQGADVSDLRLALDFEALSSSGQLQVVLTGRNEPYVFTMDLAAGKARFDGPSGRGIAGEAPVALTPGPHHLEVVNVDATFRAELDGKLISSFDYQPAEKPDRADAQVVASGGARLSISRIRLWRDIYYGFRGSNMKVIDSDCKASYIQMPSDGYFFLGDNQLASADSREFDETKTEKDIVARGIFVAWPPSRFHLVW